MGAKMGPKRKDQEVRGQVNTPFSEAPPRGLTSGERISVVALGKLALFQPLFWLWARFWVPRPQDGKKPIEYSDEEFCPASFEKKFFLKISNHKKARPTLKIFGRAISNHLINFLSLPFSGHFRMRRENQKWFRGSRKIYKLKKHLPSMKVNLNSSFGSGPLVYVGTSSLFQPTWELPHFVEFLFSFLSFFLKGGLVGI